MMPVVKWNPVDTMWLLSAVRSGWGQWAVGRRSLAGTIATSGPRSLT